LIGTQYEGAVIPEVVVMEVATGEATATQSVAKPTTSIAPGPGSSTAPELSAEAQVDPQPEAGTEVVIREAMIEDAAPLRSAPMPETGTSSRGGLKLLDDELIDPTFVSLSMESWHCTEN
jgi:hypothetical protein